MEIYDFNTFLLSPIFTNIGINKSLYKGIYISIYGYIYTFKKYKKESYKYFIPISIFSYCIAFINSCLHNVHINVAWFMADSSNVPLYLHRLFPRFYRRHFWFVRFKFQFGEYTLYWFQWADKIHLIVKWTRSRFLLKRWKPRNGRRNQPLKK